MARHTRATLALGLLAFCTGGVVVLLALYLGFYIEADEEATVNSAKGQKIAVPAVIALLAGAVAAAGWNRRWGFAVGCVAAGAAVVAVVLTLVLPGGGS